MLYGRLANANSIVCIDESQADGSKVLTINQNQVTLSTPAGQNTFKKTLIPGNFFTEHHKLENEKGEDVGQLVISKKVTHSRANTNLGFRISAKLNVLGEDYFFFSCDEIF